MKSRAGCVFAADVLAHDPGVGVADFLNRVRRQANHVRIPARDAGVVPRHALADLHQGMLDVTRLLVVLQVLGSCLSESCRPNQVFHQNRNGIRTISQPVAKNSSRLRVDMRGLAGGWRILCPARGFLRESGRADMLGSTETISEGRTRW